MGEFLSDRTVRKTILPQEPPGCVDHFHLNAPTTHPQLHPAIEMTESAAGGSSIIFWNAGIVSEPFNPVLLTANPSPSPGTMNWYSKQSV
jgi:hypothetical protein